jgi:7-carboxy-7-deazaguanine synthase
MNFEEILSKLKTFNVKHVLLTGGEPLLQRPVPAFVLALKEAGYLVSIETHGEVSIQPVAGRARIVMDIKTPSSGMARMGFLNNLPYLCAQDEVKFVIASREDYSWAKDIIKSNDFKPLEILLSPANIAPKMPGELNPISAQWLAERILEDQLPVRLQLQLHKQIWGSERIGV